MEWPQAVVSQKQSNIKWALKILFVGDTGVGKTNLMISVADGVYIDGFQKKLGSSFGARRLHFDPVRVQLQIWNVGDNPHFETIRERFYRGGAGAVFVFNIVDKTSFSHIQKWIEEVQNILGDIPGILVGNRPPEKKRRKVSKQMANSLAKKLGFPYIEVRQLPDASFEKALQDLVIEILQQD